VHANELGAVGVGLKVENGELQALSGGDNCRSIFGAELRGLRKIGACRLAEDKQDELRS
jgi:hypothetical protein